MDNHSIHKKSSEGSEDDHAGHAVARFKTRFWISLILTIPVLTYSDTIQQWTGIKPPSFIGSEYIPFILSTTIFLYGGLVFIKGAWGEIKSRQPGMMTLISLAIITAYAYSVATQFFIKGSGFYWELATLISIMLLGHWLEMASIAKAESALDDIAKLLPDKAEKILDDRPVEVLVSELKLGDQVLVRPGSNIPVDGVIIEGNSSVNEAAITGESKPLGKSIGDEVIAGTVNLDGTLTVKITKDSKDTVLAGIMRLVAEAQRSKSQTQVLANKAAFALTIIAILSAISTFVFWLFIKDTGFALERAVTVLIIACPHALGIAIPLVIYISTAQSARNGLLVRKRLALESARKIDWVLFDKTGTLTAGEHGVTDVLATKGHTTREILRLTASLEQQSEHIVGKGIVAEASRQKLKLFKTSDFKVLPGLGVSAKLAMEGNFIAASFKYVKSQGVSVPDEIGAKAAKAASDGKTAVYLIKGRVAIGAIMLADKIRDQSMQAVDKLKSMGIKTAMITGDSQGVANYVSRKLNLDSVIAEVRPEEKADKVRELQKDSSKIAFVGDGINDAPALSAADIGLAIGAGTDIAIKSADIILVHDNPLDVVKVIRISQKTYRKMIQNLFWAVGYNAFAIPLAAGVLYSYGVTLTPAAGAVLMSASTIIVAANAQLLRRFKLEG